MMQFSIIFCIFIVVVSFHESLQCSCDWGLFQLEGESIPNSICRSGRYLLFKVNKKTEIPGPSGHNEIDGKVRFTVTLLKFYTNGHEDNFSDRTVYLNAPLSGPLCSYIDFQLGKKYFLNVIGATRNFESFRFNGCHYSVSEENISNVERRIITGELDCPLEVLEWS